MTAADLVQELAARRLTLATCESLTGGLIGAVITSVPGASAVYRGGLVTYASDLKTTLAGVDDAWIASNGVINAETASQMAVGAMRRCGADLGVAVTGVAGPDAQDGHAPGEVWVGVASTHADPVAHRLDLQGDRGEVRRQTVQQAVDLLHAYVLGLPKLQFSE